MCFPISTHTHSHIHTHTNSHTHVMVLFIYIILSHNICFSLISLNGPCGPHSSPLVGLMSFLFSNYPTVHRKLPLGLLRNRLSVVEISSDCTCYIFFKNHWNQGFHVNLHKLERTCFAITAYFKIMENVNKLYYIMQIRKLGKIHVRRM